ncbi:NUDIX domain-containing protein [Rhodococcus sp. SMB37]|uniref:NUDIX hydrolase n=1 Tax=Rhodococcus sp. SMB37 TaxID=2512213 RepID=UPI0013052B3F|nr:NUDIX domain-containing protein [Rhodococcus sp. SMB37]
MSSIRNISVGLAIRSGRVLVLDGVDRVTGEAFHRAIGGGIEFGETAEAALRREFTEELGVTLGAVELLVVVENIFEYEGNPGHEIAHVFAVESPEIDAIPLDARLRVLDEGSPVRWVSIGDAHGPFYPTGVAEILDTLVGRADRTATVSSSTSEGV